ncbi:MAG TPA: hypothetical protein VFQ45_05835 [Longimicrobium sp.]|nr:hypothetical protein [Longimicrobium sp.]
MRKWLPAAVFSALAAAALPGCADGGTGPRPFEGVFVLDSIEGRPPPLIVGEHTYPNGSRVKFTTVYDSLYFGQDSLVERAMKVLVESWNAQGAANRPDVTVWWYPGKFKRQDERVIVRWNEILSPEGADTFHVRGPRLMRHDFVGVRCSEGCADPYRTEYVYTPR